MELTNWEFWTAFSRWLMYLAMAAAIGGAFSLHLLRRFRPLRQTLLSYTLGAALLGLLASAAHFFVRVGAMLETGAAGMFEPDMVSFMWQSALGDALLLRAGGFAAVVIALLLHAFLRGRSTAEEIELDLLEISIGLGGVALIALSFSEAGHAVDQPWLYQSLLAVHVVLTAWWLGSLFPLWLVCKRLAFSDAYGVLEKFGQLAVAAVLVLFAGGLYMSYQLTGWQTMLSSTYGLFLLTKVVLVGVILALAAYHKLRLVPQLLHSQDARALRRSILAEKCVGGSILAITTVLTTLVGPVH